MGSELPDRPESSSSSSPRRRLRDVAVLCLLLAILVAVLHFVPDGAERRAKAAREASASEPADRIASSTGTTATMSNSAASAPAIGASEIAGAPICGTGFVPRGEALQADWIMQKMLPDPALGARAGSALQTSADPVVRAAGTWMQLMGASIAATTPIVEQQARCNGDEACRLEFPALAKQAADAAEAPWIEALAKEAVGSRDPVLYAMATQACRTPDERRITAGSCQLVSVEQWTHIDPDNAVPWLHLASVAKRANDGATEMDALYRASIAAVHHVYGDSLVARAEPELAADLDEVDRKRAVLALGMVSESWSLPNMQTIVSACTVAAMTDANRRQLCDTLAQGFIDKAGSLVEFGMGIRIGERVGWPADRVAALKAERQALFRSDIASNQAASAQGCDFWNLMADAMLKRSREGELQYARRMLADSGRTAASYADEAARYEAMAASAAAASAATR